MVIPENTKTIKIVAAATITVARDQTVYFDSDNRAFTIITTENMEMLVNRKDANDKWKVISIGDSDFDAQSDAATRVVETKSKLFYIPKNEYHDFTFDFEVNNLFFKALTTTGNVYLTIKG